MLKKVQKDLDETLFLEELLWVQKELESLATGYDVDNLNNQAKFKVEKLKLRPLEPVEDRLRI